MQTLIIYDSLYGNTEKLAQVIGDVLNQAGETLVVRVGEVKPEMLEGVSLLVVGSPTQQFRPTAALRSFLDQLPNKSLTGKKVAAFDTRLTLAEIEKTPILAFFERIYGYADRRLVKKLKSKGGEQVLPGEGFFVQGMKGPLVEGEAERAEQWARKLFA